MLDAVLTGAKGLNLWSSFRVPPPQRSARLYRALVERGLASSVSGSLLPTEQPFLYTVSVTATDGTALGGVESALLDELDRVRREGITDAELARAKAQLRARLVFESDSVTNIAHQLGYFDTIASVDLFGTLPERIAAVTVDEVGAAARTMLGDANRTVGWFEPLPLQRLKPQGSGLKSEDAPAVRLETSELRLARGLTPTRAVLDNGAVFLGKHTHTTPAVTISLAMRAGSMCDPADARRRDLAALARRSIAEPQRDRRSILPTSSITAASA